MGADRRTREETGKWNRMTALRFQTGRRRQTSPASLWEKRAGKVQQKKSDGTMLVRSSYSA